MQQPKQVEPKHIQDRKVRILTPEEQRKEVKRKRSAALSLIKLSGQSRTPTKAALTLLKLRLESARTLRAQQQLVPLARFALEKKHAADQFLALKDFRARFPDAFRASASSALRDAACWRDAQGQRAV